MVSKKDLIFQDTHQKEFYIYINHLKLTFSIFFLFVNLKEEKPIDLRFNLVIC